MFGSFVAILVYIMMKFAPLLFLSLFIFNHIDAQQAPKLPGSFKISVRILDITGKQPLEYATISLMNDSSKKVINGGITNKRGLVELQNLAAGKYNLLVQFIGYEDYLQKISLASDLLIPEILLHKKTVELTNVTVKSTRQIIENKLDKMVYNLDKDITSQGGIATDALKKIPGVTVDIDGNV